MALIEQTINVNVMDNEIEPRLYMVQSDTGRSIRCIIKDWTIPSGSTARVYVRKTSGKVVYNTATIDTKTNSVLITVDNQMISEAGPDNLAMVEITSNGECVTSFAFFIVVKYKFGDGTESKSEVNWVEELLQQYIDEASALAKDAASSATKAETLVDDAEASVERANTAAEKAEEMIKKLEEEINDIVWSINEDDLGLDVTIYDDYQN